MESVKEKIMKGLGDQTTRESIFVFILVFILIVLYLYYRTKNDAPTLPSGYNTTLAAQQTLISSAYASNYDKKRAIINDTTKLDTMKFTCLNNFYALGCRYTGYIGPIEDGYFDPVASV